MKTGGRLVKHAWYYWLLLAEGYLNRKLFGEMLNPSRYCLCQEDDGVSIGAAGRELPRGKLGAVSAEWALAWPERLDQTDLNAGPAKIGGSNVNEVKCQQRRILAAVRLHCTWPDGQNGSSERYHNFRATYVDGRKHPMMAGPNKGQTYQSLGHWFFSILLAVIVATPGAAEPPQRVYRNELKPLANPTPLLADYPEFIHPIRESARFEGPALIDDQGADLSVRGWRFSMNARAVIEMPNRLRGDKTAVVVVHPWGINDGQGWRIPEPAGFAFGTPATVDYIARHMREVVNPLLKSLRGNVALVMYSMRAGEDPIRRRLYRSIRHRPTRAESEQARSDLTAKLRSFSYEAGSIPESMPLSQQNPVSDYFQQLPGGLFRDKYNGPGFWDLPIPIHSAIDVAPDDVVIYDADGYEALRDFLRQEGVSHILLCGYACTKCYRSTTAGYLNLEKDFNVFLVGDGTLEPTPMVDNIRFATSAAIAAASRDHLITQASWIQVIPGRKPAARPAEHSDEPKLSSRQ